MPHNSYIIQTYFVISFLFLSLKIYNWVNSFWGLVLKKYVVLISILYIPLRHWAVMIPVLILLIYLSYLVYLNIDSSHNRYTTIGTNGDNRSYGSHFLMLTPNFNQSDRDCICIDKRLCYKGYYDDVYIECVSKSLPRVINFNA